MSPRQTFTLKLGNLELQCSPAAWTYRDLKRAAEILERTKKEAKDPLLAMGAAVESLGVLIDLVVKAAKPNHPDVTCEQFEDLDLETLMELPARLAEAQMPTSWRIH
jgi:hypothetical protein